MIKHWEMDVLDRWIEGTFKWILEEVWIAKTNGFC